MTGATSTRIPGDLIAALALLHAYDEGGHHLAGAAIAHLLVDPNAPEATSATSSLRSPSRRTPSRKGSPVSPTRGTRPSRQPPNAESWSGSASTLQRRSGRGSWRYLPPTPLRSCPAARTAAASAGLRGCGGGARRPAGSASAGSAWQSPRWSPACSSAPGR